MALIGTDYTFFYLHKEMSHFEECLYSSKTIMHQVMCANLFYSGHFAFADCELY